MRDLLGCVLALLLTACLAAFPVIAAPNRALGYVLQAQSAQLDGNNALTGTNVYVGDVLETYPRGGLRMQIATNQLYLFGSSAATLREDQAGVSALLTSGTAEISTAPQANLAIRALDVTIRPKTAEATRAQVTVAGPQELFVTSFRGALELDIDGKAYTIPSGARYTVQVQSSGQKSMDAGKHPAWNQRRLILTVFIGAGAAYTALVVNSELHESEIKP